MKKFSIAFLLVVLAMATAEPPRPRPILLARNSVPPYNQRGWRPTGAAFNLPVKSQQQQVYNAPTPAPSYGPPPDGVQDGYTTDVPTTTEGVTDPTNQFLVEAENLELDPKDTKAKPKKSGKEAESPKAPLVFLLPQKQNLVYATVPQSAPLYAVPQPAFAKLQAAPAAFKVVPLNSAVTTSVFTPYSASFVQFYQ